MTPDKVEAALGVFESARRALCSQDLREVLMNVQNNINSPACAGMANAALVRMDRLPDLREALATLTSALAERERDAARFDFLISLWALPLPLTPAVASVLEAFRAGDKNLIRVNLDAAMKDTNHDR